MSDNANPEELRKSAESAREVVRFDDSLGEGPQPSAREYIESVVAHLRLVGSAPNPEDETLDVLWGYADGNALDFAAGVNRYMGTEFVDEKQFLAKSGLDDLDGSNPLESAQRAHDPEIEDLFARVEAAIERSDRYEIEGLVDELQQALYSPLDRVDRNHAEAFEEWTRLLGAESDSPNIDDTEPDREPDRSNVHIAIEVLCEELCRIVARDPREIDNLDWRRLEEVVATALRGLAFGVSLAPLGPDGGKDIVVRASTSAGPQTFYIQVKHWRSGKRVGWTPVRHFIELTASDHVAGGVFLSTSGYTKPSYSRLAELFERNVVLQGRAKVVTLCQHFVRRENGLWSKTLGTDELLLE